MGRKKIEIKLIRQEAVRRATFDKRRIGVIKKAIELSILCDCEISMTIKLLVMYWKRLNTEMYEPLYAFRKQSIISNKTKKVAAKVKNQSMRIKKQFENVVESVDKYNNLQDEC